MRTSIATNSFLWFDLRSETYEKFKIIQSSLENQIAAESSEHLGARYIMA